MGNRRENGGEAESKPSQAQPPLQNHLTNDNANVPSPNNANVEPVSVPKTVGNNEKWLESVIEHGVRGQIDLGKQIKRDIQIQAHEKIESGNHNIKQNNKAIAVLSDATLKPKLHTVTYASHGGRDDRFCRAVESSIRHDFGLVILGWGVPWRGLSQKLEAAHAYAASLPSDDVLLFTDAFDVIFSGSPQDVLDTFLAENAKIIFSAECGCWPHIMEDPNICLHKYPPSPTPYRFLNSGTWIGFAKEATEMLAEVMIEAGQNFANANDQKLVADMYIAGRHGIKLDFYNKLFQSMHMTLDRPLPRCHPFEDVQMQDGRWVNTRTNSRPAVIHFNGGGKQYHLQMESKMWYKAAVHNTQDKHEVLANQVLEVPTQAPKATRFSDICGSYLGIHH